MKKILLSLIYILISFSAYTQVPDWQEQILGQTDLNELDEESYNGLIEELSELWLMRDTANFSLFSGRLRQQLIWRSDRTLETRAGYRNQTAERQDNNKAYLGDPWHHSLRYRASLGKQWQGGLTLDKGSGEAWGQRWHGSDSWSGYIGYKGSNWLQQVIIGHYRVQMGCGLTVNQQFSLGKQYMSLGLMNMRSRLSGHSSTSESNHMQGVAILLHLGKHMTLMPWISIIPVDGTLKNGTLTALQTDGYHRTKTEEGHYHASTQFATGASLGWDTEWWHIGTNISYTRLKNEYYRTKSYYNRNYFRGHELLQGSIDYTMMAWGFTLRGETAIDDGGGIATLNGLTYRVPDSEWNIALAGRYYSRHYRQLMARSLSENSNLQAEAGLTINVSGAPWRHWKVEAMADLFSMGEPQYGYRQDSLPNGWEALVRTSYSRSRWDASVTYRYKQKNGYQRHAIEGVVNIRPTKHLSFRTQAKSRIFREGELSTGFLVSQSAGWKSEWRTGSMAIDTQFTFFNTDDYDSRVYLTEKNILYGFGIPMLYGMGVRYSLTASVAFLKHFVLDLKYALTNYANRATISSGLQQIEGNTQQQIWLQMRIKI